MAIPYLLQLGEIQFDALDGVGAWEDAGEAALVEQETLAGSPKLQFLGPKLAEHEITASLNSLVSQDPAAAIDALKSARDTGQALPLYRADGVYLGRYAVARLRVKYQRFSPQDGKVLKAELSITLREWVESEPLRLVARPKKKGRAIAKTKAGAKVPKQPDAIKNSDGYVQPKQGRA